MISNCNLHGGQPEVNFLDAFSEDLQLHSDEATPKSGHKRHYYNAAVKLDAINYAREKHSAKSGNKLNIASAAMKYKVTRSRIYEWIGQETKLKQQSSACALTIATNGSGDGKIACFKAEGSIGTKGINILRDIRAQQKGARNDYEEAGIEQEEDEISLINVSEDEILLFDN